MATTLFYTERVYLSPPPPPPGWRYWSNPKFFNHKFGVMMSSLKLRTSRFSEKTVFLLLLRCLLPFKSVVYILIYKGYFIM